jgi:hypothetical protein
MTRSTYRTILAVAIWLIAGCKDPSKTQSPPKPSAGSAAATPQTLTPPPQLPPSTEPTSLDEAGAYELKATVVIAKSVVDTGADCARMSTALAAMLPGLDAAQAAKIAFVIDDNKAVEFETKFGKGLSEAVSQAKLAAIKCKDNVIVRDFLQRFQGR